MKIIARLVIAGVVTFTIGAPVYAQTQAAPPVPATRAAPAPGQPPSVLPPDFLARKAKAKECSLKADAQGLHGEARKAFREKCKKESAGSAEPKLLEEARQKLSRAPRQVEIRDGASYGEQIRAEGWNHIGDNDSGEDRLNCEA